MAGYADGKFAMVAVGLGDAFWVAALTGYSSSKEEWRALGLDDFSSMYWAARSAPMGVVSPEVATSAFFGFHPSKAARYIPAVWDRTSPAEVLATMERVADRTLRERLGDWIESDDAVELAGLVQSAAVARATRSQGRVLFAGYAGIPWPSAVPHLTIWHSFTLLREFRGDTHNVLLVANEIDACECHLLLAAAATGGCACHAAFRAFGISVDVTTPPNPAVPTDREWPVADRRAALSRLVDRGLLTSDGSITADGMALHTLIESETDRLSGPPVGSPPEDADHLTDLLAEPVRRLRGGTPLEIRGDRSETTAGSAH